MKKRCELALPSEEIDYYYCAVNGLKIVDSCMAGIVDDCNGYKENIHDFLNDKMKIHEKL